MNKGWGMVLAVLLLLAAGLGYYGWTSGAEAKSRPILLIPKTTDPRISFWQAMRQGAEAAAREYGVEVQMAGMAAETEIEGQIRLLEEAILRKPRAIILAAADSNRLLPVCTRIKEAGIPLITVDSGLSAEAAASLIATDNYAAGRQVGDAMGALLKPGAKVAVISFVKGSTPAVERERGVRDSLEEKGITVAQTLYTNAEEELAYRLTMELLQSAAARELDGFIGLNEPSTVGAARALKEGQPEGGRVPMVGFDSSMREIAFLEEGVLQAIVVQKPFNMGYLAVKTAVEASSGVAAAPWVDTGAVTVTRSTMFSKANQKLLFPFGSEAYGGLVGESRD
ncbi:substrate-binding domain-containing protein [Paenibacillus mucilaginosus]|nr:substrate-binding domain-containing protein [Paenibacillus mucilaginosus]MCG7214855.1 substrate-binding domain-containing protein [Paenibacillus mucilaginosus]WDM26336.1 substrate-binding domain-containing protein [Paenibacillus mucilaginosus]